MAYDRINVRGIIREGNSLFLVKHKEEYNYWVLPGGGMDPGENAKFALKRELLEELGIDCNVGKLLFLQEFYATGRKINILEMFFEVTPVGTLKANSHLGTSHAHEIYKSDWIVLGEVTLLPEFLTIELLNPTGKIFFSEL